jgi:hypothetical protein
MHSSRPKQRARERRLQRLIERNRLRLSHRHDLVTRFTSHLTRMWNLSLWIARRLRRHGRTHRIDGVRW